MKLKFKKQPYQTAAVEAVADCFVGQPLITGRELVYKVDPGRVPDTPQMTIQAVSEFDGFANAKVLLGKREFLENVQAVQRHQNLPISKELVSDKVCDINLDIEMETGTGKTYCYIKSMFEMNKRYGWSKFIVVVPSIAIREGVFKSFEITAEHFLEDYGKRARFFIYNSKQLHNLESYSSDAGINVMIINVQAFNATGKDARRIYEELDDFQSRRPIDVIMKNRPILILDEPQKMEGKKTLDSFKEFSPLMILRYSATHKTEHNKIHRLDALDAYNQKLVKKIAVRGISTKGLTGTNAYLYMESIEISTSKPPVARMEMEIQTKTGIKREVRKIGRNDNLFDVSGELNQYRGFVVADIDAVSDTVSFTNGHELHAGEATGDVNEKTLRRIQIREAIKAHLDKEQVLFDQGVKVLTLFFIDEVAKYRQYDDAGEKPGEYASMFEEEYERLRDESIGLFTNTPYAKHLNGIDTHRTHNGYFSIDKKNKRLVDPDVKKKGELAGQTDDVDAYDLILKDKERLLSFEEPVRFIFSHSALREGWDNPNVFVIGTLKHSDNTVSRRQEVGRGMRLAVNQAGDRNSNRLWRQNDVARALSKKFDQQYVYDGLNRLTDFKQGLLNGSHVIPNADRAFEQQWTLDKLGNWSQFNQDDTGDGTFDLQQTRTQNQVNEITNIGAAAGPVWPTPQYDAAGNTTRFPKPADPTDSFNAVYDAWNRMVKVLEPATSGSSSGSSTSSSSSGSASLQVVQENIYDGRNYRIVRKTYADGVLDETRHCYYTSDWQAIEERLGTTPVAANAERQFVWGVRYIDDLVLRDRDSAILRNGMLNERLYATHDANWNVTTVIDDVGIAKERYEYEAYGTKAVLTISYTHALMSPFAWERGYGSYSLDPTIALYHIRYRCYAPSLGLWMQREPLEYIGSMNFYSYVSGRPLTAVDPDGLFNLLTAFIGALIGGGVAIATGQDFGSVVSSATGGFVTGGLVGSGVPPAIAAAVGNIVEQVADDLSHGRPCDVNVAEVLINAAAAPAFNKLGKAITKAADKTIHRMAREITRAFKDSSLLYQSSRYWRQGEQIAREAIRRTVERAAIKAASKAAEKVAIPVAEKLTTDALKPKPDAPPQPAPAAMQISVRYVERYGVSGYIFAPIGFWAQAMDTNKFGVSLYGSGWVAIRYDPKGNVLDYKDFEEKPTKEQIDLYRKSGR